MIDVDHRNSKSWPAPAGGQCRLFESLKHRTAIGEGGQWIGQRCKRERRVEMLELGLEAVADARDLVQASREFLEDNARTLVFRSQRMPGPCLVGEDDSEPLLLGVGLVVLGFRQGDDLDTA